MFDWEIPHTCTFEIIDKFNNSHSCGEPAAYYVWWDEYEKGEWVCQEHLDYMIASEKKHKGG